MPILAVFCQQQVDVAGMSFREMERFIPGLSSKNMILIVFQPADYSATPTSIDIS
jgi:hypothetical protein